MTSTGTHEHHEHLRAISATLRLDPLTPGEYDQLERASMGFDGDRGQLWCARSKACAPSNASAIYVLLGLGLFDEPNHVTDRELRAVRMLASGCSVAQIGFSLGYTTAASAKTHAYSLLARLRVKLGARTDAHLIRIAFRYRLLDPKCGDPPLPPWSP